MARLSLRVSELSSVFSHIGRGSVLLSISHGVSLLLSPLFLDFKSLPATSKRLYPVFATLPAFLHTITPGLRLYTFPSLTLAHLFQIKSYSRRIFCTTYFAPMNEVHKYLTYYLLMNILHSYFQALSAYFFNFYYTLLITQTRKRV